MQRAPVLLVDAPAADVGVRSAALVTVALTLKSAAGVVVVHAAHDPAAVLATERVVPMG